MKRIGLTIVLALLITVGGPRPASAKLIYDITQTLKKAIEYLKKVDDSTKKISQEINQIRLASIQGYDLSQLRKLATEFIIPELKIQQKISKIVSGSKKNKKKVKEDNQKLYKHGATRNFETKKEVATNDYSFLLSEKAIAEENYSKTLPECDQKYWDYYYEEEVWERDRKWGVYVECKTRLDLYASQIQELDAAAATMKGVIIDNATKEERARQGDDNFKERQKHKETLEDAAEKNETKEGEGGEEAKFFTTDGSAGKEWDSDGTADNYRKKSEDYYKFVRRYFYDPTDPNFAGDGAKKEKMVLFQSNLDRLNRERRFLYINSAVHLMQAAGTARREIAKRMGGEEKIAGEAAGGPNEYDAISAYSATRIENMKALLMYAQIQSAKLQYLAAKELLEAELRKDFLNKDKSEFHLIDLGKYLME